MKRYFFYTDPVKLTTPQTVNQAFGPAGTSSGNDRYRITNLHTATDAPAIAVCDGMISVQEDTTGTLSIILKPNYQPPFDFPFIKYFIYKGIKRSSIVTSNSVKFANKNSIPFIKRIDESWQNPLPDNTSNPKTNSKKVLGLAYKTGSRFDVDGTSKAIFEKTDPIDNFFYYPNAQFTLPQVRAGEKIGEFAGTFGFEIVLERLGYEPKIELTRTKTNYIKVTALTGSNYSPNDADYFKHWHDKEECLNYIDPCAFYGSFSGTKVFYYDPSKTNKRGKSNTPKEVYDDIMSKFYNKNTIYLDIRNDYNYSFNYFKNYGFDITLLDDNNELTLDTTASLWPISILKLNTIETYGSIKKAFWRTALSLPLGDNNVPLLYLSKAYVKKFRRLKRKHRLKHPNKLFNQTTGFIGPVNLSFPIIDDGGTNKFISNYYRINYYDQDRDHTNSSLVPSKAHYLNGLFRPLDLVQNLSIKGNDFRFTIWHEEALVNLTKYGGPAYISSIGIAEDQHHITLFAFPNRFIHKDFQAVPDAFTTWATQSKQSNKMFLQEIFEIFKNKELRKQTVKNTEVDNTITELDTVVVQHAPFTFLENAFRRNENPEEYVFIMFDKAEYDNIRNTLQNSTSLISNLPVFFRKDYVSDETDDGGVKYLKVVLDTSGFKGNSGTVEKLNINIDKEFFEYADI